MSSKYSTKQRISAQYFGKQTSNISNLVQKHPGISEI